jgi:hypothetical protein
LGRGTDEDGEILDATCLTRDLGLATASGVQKVLEEVGADEYAQRRVEHAFPAGDLAALQELLRPDHP